MEAGHVRISRPAILEVDTTRAIADGFTIWSAGKTVFLCEEMPPPDYLYHVEEDDPSIQDMIRMWERGMIIPRSFPQLEQKSGLIHRCTTMRAEAAGHCDNLFCNFCRIRILGMQCLVLFSIGFCPNFR